MTRRLNDATPEEWNKAQKAAPALEQPYIDMAMEEAHKYNHEEAIRTALKDLATKMPSLEDVVNKPKHYLKGNCMKYLWRYDYKGKQVEDLQKAMWYLALLTDKVTKENN